MGKVEEIEEKQKGNRRPKGPRCSGMDEKKHGRKWGWALTYIL